MNYQPIINDQLALVGELASEQFWKLDSLTSILVVPKSRRAPNIKLKYNYK